MTAEGEGIGVSVFEMFCSSQKPLSIANYTFPPPGLGLILLCQGEGGPSRCRCPAVGGGSGVGDFLVSVGSRLCGRGLEETNLPVSPSWASLTQANRQSQPLTVSLVSLFTRLGFGHNK